MEGEQLQGILQEVVGAERAQEVDEDIVEYLASMLGDPDTLPDCDGFGEIVIGMVPPTT